jgi:predicted pyridoxine 5'-phosphate oxidase superfamily flavin-nucleotide-binding protein
MTRSNTAPIASDIAFTSTVKALQARRGSRSAYARMEQGAGWRTTITPELRAFIAEQTSAFLGTANAAGQPYIQHRGGPPGFLRVLDRHTIAFAEFRGNRQFITHGNLAENPKAHLFLIDYSRRQRVKLWGTALVVDGDAALVERLTPPNGNAIAEQAVVFHVHAWDANCPRHIPHLIDAEMAAAEVEARDRRIVELEAELARLTAPPSDATTDKANGTNAR